MEGPSETRPTRLLPWLLVSPVLLATGIWLGRMVDRAPPEPAWSDAPRIDSKRIVGVPSLAPIVEQVRHGVVGLRAIRRPGAEDPQAGDGRELTSADSRGVVRGTGFVINAAGLVVTNYHIVAGTDVIFVEVPGHRPRPADLVGADPVTDIAVVRLDDPPPDLRVLELGDSTQVRQGDWVVAFGNQFQYRRTVTAGIVSYVGRHIPEEGLLVSNEYLQFSATVNPGSSGGPLLDMNGHVVGVTTSSHGTGTGISFAVPTKVLKWVLQAMDDGAGFVRRGFLGVRLEPLDSATSRSMGLGDAGGALIMNVNEDSPAAAAGLQNGDVVARYDGRDVPDAYTLFDWITYSRPDQEVEIEVIRGWKRLSPLRARLGTVELPSSPATAEDQETAPVR